MDTVLIIAVILIVFAILLFFLNSRLKPSDEMLKVFSILKDSSEKDRKMLVESLTNNTLALNQRLDATAKIMSDVSRSIGEISEIGRKMRQLQDFLQSPKIRGNIGEQVLKDLIGQIFPKSSFYLQYCFKSGEKVDAAIKTAAGILPIDSKFPMENFRRMLEAESKDKELLVRKAFTKDIKKHIVDISKKYILPEEGTMDFALMYIPSEAVYYEVINNEELVSVAQKLRVYPVSPTTLYAHLQTILLSFESQKIENRVHEVFRSLRAIQKDYSRVEEGIMLLQRHLNNAYNTMGNVLSAFSLMGQKIGSANKLEDNKL